MTLGAAIEALDALKVNAYSNEQKTAWINDLEARVQTEALRTYPGSALTAYTWATDQDATLLIDQAYDNCYVLYLTAMIDFHNMEWMTYSNSMIMFNTMFTDYRTFCNKSVAAAAVAGMTLARAIQLVDSMRDNNYNTETKTGWINELESRIQSEVLKSYPESALVQYTYAANANTVLLADAAYAGIYIKYLLYMIDANNGNKTFEICKYDFDTTLDNYTKYHNRISMAPQASTVSNLW